MAGFQAPAHFVCPQSSWAICRSFSIPFSLFAIQKCQGRANAIIMPFHASVGIWLCRGLRSLSKHRWFSGRMLACHAGGPGSIPGRCRTYLFVATDEESNSRWHLYFTAVFRDVASTTRYILYSTPKLMHAHSLVILQVENESGILITPDAENPEPAHPDHKKVKPSFLNLPEYFGEIFRRISTAWRDLSAR